MDDKSDFLKNLQERISGINQFLGIGLTVLVLIFIVIEYELQDRRVREKRYEEEIQHFRDERRQKIKEIGKVIPKIRETELPDTTRLRLVKLIENTRDSISVGVTDNEQFKSLKNEIKRLDTLKKSLNKDLKNIEGDRSDEQQEISDISKVIGVLKNLSDRLPGYQREIQDIDKKIEALQSESEALTNTPQSIPTPFGTFQIHPRMGLLLLVMASLSVYVAFWVRRQKIKTSALANEPSISNSFIAFEIPFWLYPYSKDQMDRFQKKSKIASCVTLETFWLALTALAVYKNHSWEAVAGHWVGQLPFVQILLLLLLTLQCLLVIHHFSGLEIVRLAKLLRTTVETKTSPKRRKIVIGVASSIVLIGSGAWFFRNRLRFWSSPKSSSTGIMLGKDELLVRNSATGVIHHKRLCAGHLPVAGNRKEVSQYYDLGLFHKGKSLHHMEQIARTSEDPNEAIHLLMEILNRDPGRVHIYDKLIGLYGKLREYEQIHYLLETSIKSTEEEMLSLSAFKELTDREKEKREKKLNALKNALNERLDKARERKKKKKKEES